MPDFHGYGVYIWPAYGVAFLILAGLTGFSIFRHARLKKIEKTLCK
jgi:heme exporter protein CcmD